MNQIVIFFGLVLAFVALAEGGPMRGGWASGATKDRDPSNPHYNQQGQEVEQGQTADAKADGDHPSAYTHTAKKGGNRSSFASSSGTNASSSASAK